jgi:hypothetical protein
MPAPRDASRWAELHDWRAFLRADAHVLRERPPVLFQQAANRPDGTAPARQAARRFETGVERRPWCRWINKPRSVDPCVSTLKGHLDWVYACAFSPDGSRIVSASRDRTPRIWDAGSGAELATLAGHGDDIVACAHPPDGARIASASLDRTLGIWDARSACAVRTIAGHEGWVTSCVFGHGGRLHAARGSHATRRRALRRRTRRGRSRGCGRRARAAISRCDSIGSSSTTGACMGGFRR